MASRFCAHSNRILTPGDIPVVVVTDTDIKDLNFDDVACLLRKPLETQALVVAVQHIVRQSAPRHLEAC